MASFASLPTRPPTPPKETATALDEAIQFLDTSFHLDSDARTAAVGSNTGHSSLSTPPDSSPTRRANGGESSSQSKHKKIRFEPLPSYCDGAVAAADATTQLRPLPTKDQKYSKSILKPFDPPSSHESADAELLPTSVVPHHFSSFAAMLESLLKQLAGNDRISRLHGYITFSGSLKAYERTPDPEAIQAKLPELEQYIRRDVVAVHPDSTAPDAKLRSQALKLASVLLWRLSGSQDFSNSFIQFLVDHATNAIKDTTLTKEVLLSEMHLLTISKLYGKAMTTDKINKILIGLKDIHERISGNNVVRLRLGIYKGLVSFAPVVMLDGIRDWLDHVFLAMLSSDKEASQIAIDTGLASGFSLGTSRRAAEHVRELLNPSQQDGDSDYLGHLEKRLLELLATEQSHNVPRVWSVILLLSRGKPSVLERWLRQNQLLKVMENCFNSSEHSLNMEAFAAWNRAIFSVSQILMTRPTILRPLRAPIISTLQRRSSNKELAKVQEAAFSSLCLLLYHTFGPTTKIEDLDACWKETVQEFYDKIAFTNATSFGRACRLLSALLADSSTKVWSANRALDVSQPIVRPDEVPRVNAHWLRRNVALVLRTIEGLLFNLQQSGMQFDQSPAFSTWTNMLKAVSDAGSKEIKASADLKQTIAEILNSFFRMRARVHLLSSRNTSEMVVSAGDVLTLMQSAIDTLGPLHFVEPILFRTKDGLFKAATSPSAQSGYGMYEPASAIVYMVKLLSKPQRNAGPIQNFEKRVAVLLRPCHDIRPTLLAKLSLLTDCAESVSRDSHDPKSSSPASGIFGVICDFARELLSKVEQGQYANNTKDTYPLHSRILESIVPLKDRAALAEGKRYYRALRSHAKQNGTEGIFVLALARPLIESIGSEMRAENLSVLTYLSTMLDEGIPFPPERVLEYAQKALEMSVPKFRRIALHNWPNSFISNLDNMMFKSYESLEKADGEQIADLLTSVTSLIRSHSSTHDFSLSSYHLLKSLQRGTSAWAEDKINKLKQHSLLGLRPASTLVGNMWSAMLSLVSRDDRYNDMALATFETFWCSGFQSRNKKIASATIRAWNESFGNQDCLEYPSDLRRLLCRLQHLVDIKLPTQPAKSQDELVSKVPSDEIFFPWMTVIDSPDHLHANDDIFHRFSSPLPRQKQLPDLLSRSNTPTLARHPVARPLGTTPPARLRHDDSQVNFVAIDSPPVDLKRVDSQNFTEHQREVRSRQKEDTVLYAGISSSPPSSSFPRVQFAQGVPTDVNKAIDVNSRSIRLSTPDVESSDHVDSSPLGLRNRSQSHQPLTLSVASPGQLDGADDDVDIPSSPPEPANLVPRPKSNLLARPVVEDENHERVEQPRSPVQPADGPTAGSALRTPAKVDIGTDTSPYDANRQLFTEMKEHLRASQDIQQANPAVEELEAASTSQKEIPAVRRRSAHDKDSMTNEADSPYLQNLSPNSSRPYRTIVKPLEVASENNLERVADSFDQNRQQGVLESEEVTAIPQPEQPDNEVVESNDEGDHASRGPGSEESSLKQAHQTSVNSSVETSQLRERLLLTPAADKQRPVAVSSQKRKAHDFKESTPPKRAKTDAVSAVAENADTEDDCIIVTARKIDTPSLLEVLQSRGLLEKRQSTDFAASDIDSKLGMKRKTSLLVQDEDGLKSSAVDFALANPQSPKKTKRQRLSQLSQESSSRRRSSRRSGSFDQTGLAIFPPRRRKRRSNLQRELDLANEMDQHQESNESQQSQDSAAESVYTEVEQSQEPDLVLVESSQVVQPAEDQGRESTAESPSPEKNVAATINTAAEIQNIDAPPEDTEAADLLRPDDLIAAKPLSNETANLDQNEDAETAQPLHEAQDDAFAKRTDTFNLPQTPQKPTVAAPVPSTPQTQVQNTATDSAPATPSSLARNLIGRLGRILTDCKTLILGQGHDNERHQLEDLSFELQREIVNAGRRSRK